MLTHNWFFARETALARVRALPRAGKRERVDFARALEEMRERVAHWRTADPRQSKAIGALKQDLDRLARESPVILAGAATPWDALYRFAEERLSFEGQEACLALLLEPHGDLIDDLADAMKADESLGHAIDGGMSCGALRALIEDR